MAGRRIGTNMVATDEIIESYVEESNKKKNVKRFKIVDLETNPLNMFSMREIDLLAQNILANGLFTPIIIYQTTRGTMRLLGGHRRLAASKINIARGGDDYIDCIVVDKPMNELIEMKIIAVLNNQREFTNEDKLELIKSYEAVYKSLDKEDKKVNGISLKMREWIGLQTGINLSGRQVQNYLSQLDGKKVAMIATKKIKVSTAKGLTDVIFRGAEAINSYEYDNLVFDKEQMRRFTEAINELECALINMKDFNGHLKTKG